MSSRLLDAGPGALHGLLPPTPCSEYELHAPLRRASAGRTGIRPRLGGRPASRAPIWIRKGVHAAALLLFVSAAASSPAWADGATHGTPEKGVANEHAGGGSGSGSGHQAGDSESKTVAATPAAVPQAASSPVVQETGWQGFFETMGLGTRRGEGAAEHEEPPMYLDPVLGLPAVVHFTDATDDQLRRIIAPQTHGGGEVSAPPLLDRPVSLVKVAVDAAMPDERWEEVRQRLAELFAPREGASGQAAPTIERVPVKVEGIVRQSIAGAVEAVEKKDERAREKALAAVATLAERTTSTARAMPGKLAAIPGQILGAAKGAAQAIVHPKTWWAEKSSGGAQSRNQAFGAVWGFGWTLVDVGLWLGVVGGGPGVIAFALSMGLNHIWSVWPNELNDAFAYGGWTRVLFGTKGGTRAYEASDLLMTHFGLGPAFTGDADAARKAIAAKLGIKEAELGEVFGLSTKPISEGATPTLVVDLNIGALRKRRSAARAAMEKQTRAHREQLAGVLAAGEGKWEAIQNDGAVATAADKDWAAWERAAGAFSAVENQANKLGRAVASGTDASKGNPWQRIGTWIEGSALRKGQIAHLANGSAWMLVFLQLSYLGGLSSFGALSLPALAIVATAIPASLICSSGFWGSQVMNRQHLLTSQGRWVFSLIGDTFFRINSKIAQTGSLWLWAAAIGTEFGWAGYRYATGLVGQRQGPPHGVGQLLKGLVSVGKTEFTEDVRPVGENASGVVALVHPSAVTATSEVMGDKHDLGSRGVAFQSAVAGVLGRELEGNALYNLGVEGVASGGTPGRITDGPQKAEHLVRQLEQGLNAGEQAERTAWQKQLAPQRNQPTFRALVRGRYNAASKWVAARRSAAGGTPAMAAAGAH